MMNPYKKKEAAKEADEVHSSQPSTMQVNNRRSENLAFSKLKKEAE